VLERDACMRENVGSSRYVLFRSCVFFWWSVCILLFGFFLDYGIKISFITRWNIGRFVLSVCDISNVLINMVRLKKDVVSYDTEKVKFLVWKVTVS